MAGKSTLDLTGESGPPRILVCEDNHSNMKIMKSLLTQRGFYVMPVYSAEEALQEVRKHSYDLILLDIELPGMSGLELTRMLREEQFDEVYLPVILLTARTDEESRLEGLKSGATDFLTKPFDPSELVARIHNFVGAKRVHDRLVSSNRALEKEREKVVAVQRGLLPSSFPAIEGHDFAVMYKPHARAGGDFYDVFFRENGKLLILVGDVSGSGIPASIYMAIVRAVLHAEEELGTPIIDIIKRLNRILCHGLDAYSFVTLYFAEYDIETRTLEQISAGHVLPIQVKRESGRVETRSIEPTVALGIEAPIEVSTTILQLEPGDRLIVYTDGISEQVDIEGKFYGEECFLTDCSSLSHENARGFVNGINDRLTEFAGTSQFRDDLTLLVMDIASQ